MGAKLGGVSPFRVVSISRAVARCKVARLKAAKRQESYAKGSEKIVPFSRVSEATLGSFSGHVWDVLGAKLGGVSPFRVVSISRAVARCNVARLKAAKRQESYTKGSENNVFFYRVSEATLGTFPGHLWDALGGKLGGVSAFRVVSMSRPVAPCKVARLKVSKRQESYRKGSQKIVFFSKVSEATLGSLSGHFLEFLGCFGRDIIGTLGSKTGSPSTYVPKFTASTKDSRPL